MATRHGLSQASASRILKKDGEAQMFKEVEKRDGAEAQVQGCVEAAIWVREKLDAGKWCRAAIWCPDESWFDAQDNWFNQQNEPL